MFFSRKPSAPPPRHFQKHEYLDLLQGGSEEYAVSDQIKRAALALLQSHAEALKLEAEAEPELASIFARRCRSQDALLVHVPVGLEDCFLIVIFMGDESHAHGFILFDIGAQYLQPVIECLDFGPKAPVTEANIREWVPLLLSSENYPFAIIELRGGTYIQVYSDLDGFHLEHQMVTTGAHYRYARGPVEVDEAIEVLISYAFGRYEWAYKGWEKMAL